MTGGSATSPAGGHALVEGPGETNPTPKMENQSNANSVLQINLKVYYHMSHEK